VARETIESVKSQKKKKWISDDTYAVIREKREAKGRNKNRYQELKAEVQKKFSVDKQQQLEGMSAELEAANTKGNSRQVFQIVKSMTRKFQPRLQCTQSATGENLTHQSHTGGKGIVKTCTMMRKGMELNKNIGRKSLHHFVQRLLVRSVRQHVAKPQVLMMSQQNCSKQEERQQWSECTEYVWRPGKLVSAR